MIIIIQGINSSLVMIDTRNSKNIDNNNMENTTTATNYYYYQADFYKLHNLPYDIKAVFPMVFDEF